MIVQTDDVIACQTKNSTQRKIKCGKGKTYLHVFSRFTSVTQRITRMKEMTREDEIEGALPCATRRRKKRSLLQFWSRGKSEDYKCPLWVDKKKPLGCHSSKVSTDNE